LRVTLRDDFLILAPEDDADREQLDAWKSARDGHVFFLDAHGRGLALRNGGPREVACREPINVVSTSDDEAVRLIGNFAPTPFVLDGARYASVESFWQGLKFDDPRERRRIASLDGPEAKRAGSERGYGEAVEYGGRPCRVGTAEHWNLMERACRAKFQQNAVARDALLATAPRPLVHRVRHDSRAIPGVVIADIWMRIREDLLAEGRRDAGG
jgi:predicted NAD-dependent protein-ADP-ribosyltransferase YbiA (DUF1768 family)